MISNYVAQSVLIYNIFFVVFQLTKHPDFQQAGRIAIYINMKNEVGTYDILKEAFNLKKQVYIPL